MSATLFHQDLRGLARNRSWPRPLSRSQVHLTSAAVKGFPSCHLTPGCSLKVSALPSSLHDQLSASSGRIVARLFCAMCWSYTTRLLKTPIIGISVVFVPYTWLDIEDGL